MNFITAFHAEALPLIEKFELFKKTDSSLFPVFSNDSHKVVISGLGRQQASTATKYLIDEILDKPEPVINLGIAGHGELARGTPFIANRIFHSEEKAVHYPPPILNLNIASSALQTCDSPETNYTNPIGYDMEAHAFCSTAYHSITRELVQTIKFVSDNPTSRLISFSPKIASEIIGSHLQLVEEITNQLQNLSEELQIDPEIPEMIKELKSTYHFTFTQTHQLEKLIRHSFSLGMQPAEWSLLVTKSSTGKMFLSLLAQKLRSHRTFS
jgi:hypothetical protein